MLKVLASQICFALHTNAPSLGNAMASMGKLMCSQTKVARQATHLKQICFEPLVS